MAMAAFTVRSLTPVPNLLLTLVVAIFVTLPTGAAPIPSDEYLSMQRVLRSRGYAMAATALEHKIILTLPPNTSYTIFAPTDASVLNKIRTASFYAETLRLHVIPVRLSLSELESISSDYLLPTLLPYHALRLTNSPLRVAGVDVTDPGIFYSGRFAVHGLAGFVYINRGFYYGGGAVYGGKAENDTTVEDEKTRAEAEKTRAEAEKIRAEAQKMREDKAWITHKTALCIFLVICFAALTGVVVWCLYWAGLIGDWLCAKTRYGNLKKTRELERAQLTELKEVNDAMTDDAAVKAEIMRIVADWKKSKTKTP